MKNPLLIALLLISPCLSHAQTDTTGNKGLEGHELDLKLTDDGFKAQVNRMDTVHKDDPDTLRFETRRKIYTIITTKRQPSDSVQLDKAEEDRAKRRQRRNLFTYWSGLDLGLNNLLSADGTLDRDSASKFMDLKMARSRFFAINFMEQKIEFGSHHAGLMTGMGIEFTSYHLENNDRLQFNSDSTWAAPADPIHLSKNKLRQIGLRVPLMLEFNTGRAEEVNTTTTTSSGTHVSFDHLERKNNFHIAVGVVGSLYFDTMYKVKYEQDGETQKDRNGGSYNLLPYRLSGSVRLGWNSFNLFAEYGLTQFFKDGYGPELTPINVGITLIGFN